MMGGESKVTLKQDISDYLAEWRKVVPADFQQLTEQYVATLATGATNETALRQGDHAPPVVLPDASGRIFDVADLLKLGPVILSFYRGSWCPFCNLELRAYQNALPDIRAAGASLVAVSPELPEWSRPLETYDFIVLSDVGNLVARSFGLVHHVPADLRAATLSHGLDVAVRNGTPGDWILPVSATYAIDRDGSILFAHTEVDPRQRAEPSEIIAILNARKVERA